MCCHSNGPATARTARLLELAGPSPPGVRALRVWPCRFRDARVAADAGPGPLGAPIVMCCSSTAETVMPRALARYLKSGGPGELEPAVFEFFFLVHSLERITLPWLRFEVLALDEMKMRKGALIERSTRLRGIPLRWLADRHLGARSGVRRPSTPRSVPAVAPPPRVRGDRRRARACATSSITRFPSGWPGRPPSRSSAAISSGSSTTASARSEPPFAASDEFSVPARSLGRPSKRMARWSKT